MKKRVLLMSAAVSFTFVPALFAAQERQAEEHYVTPVEVVGEAQFPAEELYPHHDTGYDSRHAGRHKKKPGWHNGDHDSNHNDRNSVGHGNKHNDRCSVSQGNRHSGGHNSGHGNRHNSGHGGGHNGRHGSHH